MPARTVFSALEETARQQGDRPALHQPIGGKQGGHRTYTWNEWLTASREIALGLRALQLKKGDIVCILSETRAEFYLADLGVMGAGGVAAALYVSYPMPELAKNVRNSQAGFLMVENAKSLSALTEALQGVLPPNVVLLVGEAPGALSLDALREKGRALLAADPGVWDRICGEIEATDPAILYLTSGATGEPKMGLSSHIAILSNIDMGPAVLPIGPDDCTLVFLPSAHIAQRIVLELVPMRMGTPVWFSESLAKMPGELRTIRPTFFLAPPRVWERMYATICTEAAKRSLISRKIFHGSLGLGMEAARLKLNRKPIPGWMNSALKVSNKLVFSKVRERLGGRLRIAACGAAPLGKDLSEFFAAIGMPLVEGFGLTEAGILCFNPMDRPKPGSIGKLLPGVEARIADDGELQVRTPCIFLGYYNDPVLTKAVLTPDGWFSTGDIAEVDDEGYYFITGRKKELIVSSNGKKIYPARIEGLMKMDPLVNQVVLIGDKQPYVTALLTLHATSLKNVKGIETVADEPVEKQLESAPVTEAVQATVTKVNKQLADFERIRRFKVLARDFSIESGELTPTMKIRKAKVLENNRELVSELYLGRGESQLG